MLRLRRRSHISLARAQTSDKEIEHASHSRLGLAFSVGAPAAVLAHHGWGSYDASKTVVVEGPIETSNYANPHATITVKAADKTWTVTLAPASRMQSRGAPAELVAVGKTVKAEGYASTSRDR